MRIMQIITKRIQFFNKVTQHGKGPFCLGLSDFNIKFHAPLPIFYNDKHTPVK